MKYILLLIISFTASAEFIEYKKNGKVYFVRDTVADEHYKPSQLKDIQAYKTAKSNGLVRIVPMTPAHYKYNPENVRKAKLKAKLKKEGFSKLTNKEKDLVISFLVRNL